MVRTGNLFRTFALFVFLFAVTANCTKDENDGTIFCSNPLFPFFCPSAGKCTPLAFYGKNLDKSYSSLSDCGSSGQSCESCTIEENNTVAKAYIYANWDCGGSSACETTMGAPNGTAGPFCDSGTCTEWGDKFIPGGYTCDSTPVNIPNIGTPPDGVCFKTGDF
ncbi:MAG: hypothetical protein RIA63_11640 [Cyclobacteriaceae bacterium]